MGEIRKTSKTPNGYQIFNLAIRERKKKDNQFSPNVEDRKEKWRKISSKISGGKISATKKDIRPIIDAWEL